MKTVEQPCQLKRCGDKEYFCNFELALQIIGGKWKPLILFKLHKNGVLRFGELRRTMPKITQKMLTQQLRELEHDSMVHRQVYAQVPPKVEYSLTEVGRSFIPILEGMCDWGKLYEERFGSSTAEEQHEELEHLALA